jgi:hypothetical protein
LGGCALTAALLTFQNSDTVRKVDGRPEESESGSMDKALADELIRRILISLRISQSEQKKRLRQLNRMRNARLPAMKRLRYSRAPFQFRG